MRACPPQVDLATWMGLILRDARLVRTALATAAMRGIDFDALPPAPTDAERVAALWLHEQRRWTALCAVHGARLMTLGFDDVPA